MATKLGTNFNDHSTAVNFLNVHIARPFSSCAGRDFCFTKNALEHALEGRKARIVVRRLKGAGKTIVSRSFTHGGRSNGLFIHSWAWWTAFLKSLIVHRRYTVYISSMISQHRKPLQTTNARASFKLIFCDQASELDCVLPSVSKGQGGQRG